MSETKTYTDLSDATKEALEAVLTAAWNEMDQCEYKPLSAMTRVAIKGMLRRAENETKPPKDDGRVRLYTVEDAQISDVTLGEDKPEIERRFPTLNDVAGFDQIIYNLQYAAGSLHGFDTPPPEEMSTESLKARQSSFHSMLTEGDGKCMFRVRYEVGEAKYLLEASIARQT